MSEPLDLDAIEQRAKAATPGPWVVTDSGHDGGAAWVDGPDEDAPSAQVFTGEAGRIAEFGGVYGQARNAAFIAHAREDVPALVARVRELESDVRHYETALRSCASEGCYEAPRRCRSDELCPPCIAKAALDAMDHARKSREALGRERGD